MDEEYITIPKSEYDFLLSCKQELIKIHEAEIQKCYNEIQIENVRSFVDSFKNKEIEL